MLNINVKVDVVRALAKLRDVSEKQVPFATALALTTTAKEVQRTLTDELDKSFDKPTPFTRRAIGVERATKQDRHARVFIKRDQLKYLAFGIDGGTRKPAKRAIPIPVDQPVNQYGNLPRNKLRQLLARRDVFSGKVNGVGGIWQRKAHGKLVLLVSWKPQAIYKKRYPFFELGESSARAAFPSAFRTAVTQAMASAR